MFREFVNKAGFGRTNLHSSEQTFTPANEIRNRKGRAASGVINGQRIHGAIVIFGQLGQVVTIALPLCVVAPDLS